MSVLRTPLLQPGEALVELHNVSRRFEKRLDRSRSLQELFIRIFRGRRPAVDEFWPVRDVSLTIHPGDCVGIIGPNGSGKSTLLKVVTGILSPTHGDLVVRGRVSSLLELGAGFHPDLTGRENIFLNGSIYGLNRAQMNERLESIIEYAGLGDFIDTPVKHYSSGMYVRLGFAVAIHTDPDLLLVDEVLAVGDSVFQNRCMESIYRFRRHGGTLLLVSHDLNTIQTLCTRAVWIENGVVAADGHPADVVMAYKQHVAQHDGSGDPAGEAGHWGVGDIRITQVDFVDGGGVPHSAWMTGDEMIVRLQYHAARPVERPVFGLAFHHQNGTHIFGPNTKFSAQEIGTVEGDGVIAYRLPRLPLLEGQYAVSVAVVNETDTVTFDYHDRAYSFRVIHTPERTGYGLVQLPGVWEIPEAVQLHPTPPATPTPAANPTGARPEPAKV